MSKLNPDKEVKRVLDRVAPTNKLRDIIWAEWGGRNGNSKSGKGIEAIEAYIADRETKARIDELERLKQWNGSYIGIGGKRVDNMLHHDVIDNRIKALKSNERVRKIDDQNYVYEEQR